MTPTILEITDGAAIVRRPVTDGDHARAADLDCTVAGLPYAEACDGESIVERVSFGELVDRWPVLAARVPIECVVCGERHIAPPRSCASAAEDMERAWHAAAHQPEVA